MAARGVCITLLIISALSIGGPGADLAQDECRMSNSKNLNYAAIAISVITIPVYAWGIWVAQSKNGAMASALFVAHIIMAVLNIGVGFCSAGAFSKNAREKDPALAAACFVLCEIDPPRGFGNNSCEISNNIAPGIGSLVINILVWGYFGYVLWSFMTKISDGTVDNAGNMIVTMAPMAQAAAPMAVGYAPQATAFAAPVQAQAVPVAQAQPIAQAQAIGADQQQVYPDLNKPPMAHAQAI